MSITLDNLMEQARERADMVNGEFIEDAELIRLINRSQEELYDLLVASYGIDNFVDGYNFNTIANRAEYNLPVDFYKFCGIDMKVGTTWHSLVPFRHADRNKYLSATEFIVDGKPRIRYAVRTGHIELLPEPETAYDCRMWFIPQVAPLVNTSDTIKNGIVGSFVSYIIADVAQKMCAKEETERPDLVQEKQETLQRISMSTQRNLDTPEADPDANLTLFNLRIQARYKADMLTDKAVTDIELDHYINQSYGELQDILVGAYGNHYFLDGYEFVTEVGKRDYDLPTDFYKLGGLDVDYNGHKYSVMRFNFQERNLHENSANWKARGVPYLEYELIGNSIRILPVVEEAYSMTMWYTKRLSMLTKDSSTMSSVLIRDWSEYLLCDVAIKMLNKKLLRAGQETVGNITQSIALLSNAKMEQKERLTKVVENRDWGQPRRSIDMRALHNRRLI